MKRSLILLSALLLGSHALAADIALKDITKAGSTISTNDEVLVVTNGTSSRLVRVANLLKLGGGTGTVGSFSSVTSGTNTADLGAKSLTLSEGAYATSLSAGTATVTRVQTPWTNSILITGADGAIIGTNTLTFSLIGSGTNESAVIRASDFSVVGDIRAGNQMYASSFNGNLTGEASVSTTNRGTMHLPEQVTGVLGMAQLDWSNTNSVITNLVALKIPVFTNGVTYYMILYTNKP